MKGVDLDQPLSYADRFRIRNPDRDQKWQIHMPHIDSEKPDRYHWTSFSLIIERPML